MGLSRRTVLQAAGGAGLALIGTGGLFSVSRTPEKALQAWRAIDEAATRRHTTGHPYRTPFWRPIRTTGSPGRYVIQAQILRRSFATLIAVLQRLIPVIARRRSASEASSNWHELPRRSAVSAWN